MSLFLAALMCVTTFAGFGTTAYAAEETDEVYLVSFPRDGDDNYSGEWGHGSHEFMNGWATEDVYKRQLHCNFDNGRQLGIVPGEDSFRRLTDQELAEEKDSQKRQLTEMSEDELYERNIFRFDSFDDFFDFIYDENTDKADIINEMSQQMKIQLVSEKDVYKRQASKAYYHQ